MRETAENASKTMTALHNGTDRALFYFNKQCRSWRECAWLRLNLCIPSTGVCCSSFSAPRPLATLQNRELINEALTRLVSNEKSDGSTNQKAVSNTQETVTFRSTGCVNTRLQPNPSALELYSFRIYRLHKDAKD